MWKRIIILEKRSTIYWWRLWITRLQGSRRKRKPYRSRIGLQRRRLMSWNIRTRKNGGTCCWLASFYSCFWRWKWTKRWGIISSVSWVIRRSRVRLGSKIYRRLLSSLEVGSKITRIWCSRLTVLKVCRLRKSKKFKSFGSNWKSCKLNVLLKITIIMMILMMVILMVIIRDIRNRKMGMYMIYWKNITGLSRNWLIFIRKRRWWRYFCRRWVSSWRERTIGSGRLKGIMNSLISNLVSWSSLWGYQG